MTHPIQQDLDFLEHHDVKSQKWGVRNDRPDGVSRRTNKDARKDAEEFARAKLFYGKTAGTRRKLIHATVEAKRKKDPKYGEAFDKHLSKQDMSTHAEKARAEQTRKDRKEKAQQVAGHQARRLTGEMGTTAAFTAAVLAGSAYIRSPKGRSTMNAAVKKASDFVKSKQMKQTTDFLEDIFKRNA